MSTRRDHRPVQPAHTVVFHSSKSLPWNGISLEQRFHPAGEYIYPAFSTHLICLHQGPPAFVEQIGNSQSHRGMMRSGSIQIIPAGTACTWRHSSGTGFLCLSLAPEVIKQVAADLPQNNNELLAHFGIQDPGIEHICLALLTELAGGGLSGRLYSEGLTTALAAHLVSSYSNMPRSPLQSDRGLSAPLLRRLTSFIEDRLAEDLGLAELASEAGLSQSHFASLFRLSTGLAPHRYILQRRVERARFLLQTTTLSIGEIAGTVGFYDQSHLTRQMRRVLGVTPKYIRDHSS